MVVDSVPVYSCCAWENRLVVTESFGFILIDDGGVAVVCADGEFARRSAGDLGAARIPGSLNVCWLDGAA